MWRILEQPCALGRASVGLAFNGLKLFPACVVRNPPSRQHTRVWVSLLNLKSSDLFYFFSDLHVNQEMSRSAILVMIPCLLPSFPSSLSPPSLQRAQNETHSARHSSRHCGG